MLNHLLPKLHHQCNLPGQIIAAPLGILWQFYGVAGTCEHKQSAIQAVQPSSRGFRPCLNKPHTSSFISKRQPPRLQSLKALCVAQEFYQPKCWHIKTVRSEMEFKKNHNSKCSFPHVLVAVLFRIDGDFLGHCSSAGAGWVSLTQSLSLQKLQAAVCCLERKGGVKNRNKTKLSKKPC